MTSNIIYISYGPYTTDADWNITYEIVPEDNEEMITTGPFADSNYEPLDYDDTYYIYLDGMGDIDGWYTGTGSNAEDATVNALEAEGITVDTSGWAIRINDFIQDSSMGYGISSRTRPWVTESTDTVVPLLRMPMLGTSSTALSLRM